jgi:hypothetical protein
MNALTEKMKDAGVDTIGARLTTACVDAIRKHPDSVADAWRYVGAAFGHEFIRNLMTDMQRHAPAKEATMPLITRAFPAFGASTPYKPRVFPPERLEKRRELEHTIRSKYKNSGGVSWSDVGWHELAGLKRDGNEAAALLNAGPANVPNDGRSVNDVLGTEKINEIIAQVRALVK